jgi:hypothetical protein
MRHQVPASSSVERFVLPKLLVSKFGFILCAINLTVAVLSLSLSYLHPDPKGTLLLNALSILPAGVLVTCLGLWPTVYRHPELNNVLIWIPISLMTCYGIGLVFTLLGRIWAALSQHIENNHIRPPPGGAPLVNPHFFEAGRDVGTKNDV